MEVANFAVCISYLSPAVRVELSSALIHKGEPSEEQCLTLTLEVILVKKTQLNLNG